jgi:hypothetical protein
MFLFRIQHITDSLATPYTMRLTSCSLSYSKKSVYVCMHILLSIFFLPFFLLRWKMALTGTCPKVNTYGNKVPFLLDDTTWRVIKPVNSRVPYVTDDERRHRQRTSRPCRLQTKLKVTFHSVTPTELLNGTLACSRIYLSVSCLLSEPSGQSQWRVSLRCFQDCHVI